MKPGAFIRILRAYPDARRIWISETTSAFGTYFYNIALMWYVFVRTGSGLSTALVAVASMVPQVALGAWFGVLADRRNRRRIMAGANLASAGLAGVLAAAVALHMNSVWPAYAITFLMGTASTLYAPARQAIFPEIVGQDDLLTTHALFHSSRQVARLVGSSVGGLVVTLAGPAPTMALNGATFMIAAAFVASMGYVPRRRNELPGEKPPRALESLRGAWQWMRTKPVLLVMGGIGMVSNIALGPTNVLPPMLIRTTFHASAAALGLFDAAIGLGVILGGVVIGMLTINRMGLSMAVALGTEMLGLVLVWLSPSPVFADLGNLVLGVGLVTANAPGEAMAQTIVPADLLGRVSSFFFMLSAFAIPITYGGVGVVGDAMGAHTAYGLAAALMATTVAAALLVPGIRRFRLDEHRTAPRDPADAAVPAAD